MKASIAVQGMAAVSDMGEDQMEGKNNMARLIMVREKTVTVYHMVTIEKYKVKAISLKTWEGLSSSNE